MFPVPTRRYSAAALGHADLILIPCPILPIASTRHDLHLIFRDFMTSAESMTKLAGCMLGTASLARPLKHTITCGSQGGTNVDLTEMNLTTTQETHPSKHPSG